MRRRRDVLGPAPRIARDATADLLVGAVFRRDAAARQALELGLVAQHRILDVFSDLVESFGLVVMGIDVDDQEILVVALDRLLVACAAASWCRTPRWRDRESCDPVFMRPR